MSLTHRQASQSAPPPSRLREPARRTSPATSSTSGRAGTLDPNSVCSFFRTDPQFPPLLTPSSGPAPWVGCPDSSLANNDAFESFRAAHPGCLPLDLRPLPRPMPAGLQGKVPPPIGLRPALSPPPRIAREIPTLLPRRPLEVGGDNLALPLCGPTRQDSSQIEDSPRGW